MYKCQLLSFRHVVFSLSLVMLFKLVTSQDFNYNPFSNIGPQFWLNLPGSFCGGVRQSPIALSQRRSQYTKFQKITFLNYNSYPTSATIVNNGHSVQVTPQFNQTPVISDGDLPGDYQLIQYHFHWGSNSKQGSEHVFEGVQYAMELHLVHTKIITNAASSATASSDGIAVLGVLFELGKFDNPVLTPIIQTFTQIKNSSAPIPFNPIFRLMDYLPLDKNNFYRYLGSLTTPLCNESVVWTAFTSTVPISERQLAEFRLLLDHDGNALVDNFRPIQALNSRAVYRSGHFKLFDVCFIPIICPLLQNFIKTFLIVLRTLIIF